jgi:hypothetical protein
MGLLSSNKLCSTISQREGFTNAQPVQAKSYANSVITN